MDENSPWLGCRILIHARPWQAQSGRVIGAYPMRSAWRTWTALSIRLDAIVEHDKPKRIVVRADDVTVLERPRTDLGRVAWLARI